MERVRHIDKVCLTLKTFYINNIIVFFINRFDCTDISSFVPLWLLCTWLDLSNWLYTCVGWIPAIARLSSDISDINRFGCIDISSFVPLWLLCTWLDLSNWLYTCVGWIPAIARLSSDISDINRFGCIDISSFVPLWLLCTWLDLSNWLYTCVGWIPAIARLSSDIGIFLNIFAIFGHLISYILIIIYFFFRPTRLFGMSCVFSNPLLPTSSSMLGRIIDHLFENLSGWLLFQSVFSSIAFVVHLCCLRIRMEHRIIA